MNEKVDMRGLVPESWACIDCGINTAPGVLNRVRIEQALAADWNNQGVEQTVDEWSEVYIVKPSVWRAAGMEQMGGCLCIGCLEGRIGRTLVPKDFPRKHPLNRLPGTERLLSRRGDVTFPSWADDSGRHGSEGDALKSDESPGEGER
ncbi:hypothetical protein [Bradyrhizobium sp.]|uniref:hypothetical protein n=1 Tax=Bradyrhizobium sp. TaxID=376 RepID=UPI003BB12201